MDVKQLRYFVAIAEAGNISAAAKKLHLSQPPLSLQLKLLEQELGAVLIERGARRCTLTDAGRLLYRRALTILQQVDTTSQEIEDLSRGLNGTLRLGTISSCGTELLGPRMERFSRCAPGIRFDLYEGNTFELLEKLDAGLIEMAVVRTPFLAESVVCHDLLTEPMAVVADARFFAGLPSGSLKLAQLAKKPILYYRRYEALLLSAFEDCGVHPNVFCRCDDARTCLLWARAALGMALVPRSAARMIPGENLVLRELDEARLISRITLIHRKNQPLSAAAQGFLQHFLGEE